MSKQVEQTPQNSRASSGQSTQGATKKLFFVVDTFNDKAEKVGTRIVDLYHYGTRDWLAKHLWWAFHNMCVVNQRVATDEEISGHVEAQKLALAEKFNSVKAA